jgi:hypothetical protein
MPITVSGTSITFNDSTTQTTAFTGGGGVTSLNGQTGAITTTSFDVIGSTAWLGNGSTTRGTAGTTIAGSSLRYATTITHTEYEAWFCEGSPNAPRPSTKVTAGYFLRSMDGNPGWQAPGGTTTVSGTWRALHMIPERRAEYDGDFTRGTTWQGLFVRVS